MRDGLLPCETAGEGAPLTDTVSTAPALYRALCEAGLGARHATELQNLATHCGYRTYSVNCADGELCVLTRDLPLAETLALVSAAAEACHTVVVIAPREARERRALYGRIVDMHRSTTIDRHAYLLVFNNHLPKQHFRI